MKDKATARAKHLNSVLPLYKPAVQKAFDGTASPRGAIKANCLQCVGYVRDYVRTCRIFECPLYEYRPYQTNEDGDAE